MKHARVCMPLARIALIVGLLFSVAVMAVLPGFWIAGVNAAAGATRSYLPIVTRNSMTRPSVFGVENSRGTVGATVQRAGEARAGWVRYNAVLWSEVEPTRGARNWAALAGVDAELQALSSRGIMPLVIVRGTPEWAQQVPGAGCGAIRADALDAFAAFMRDLAARYASWPYNVQYWELYNEPDIDPSLVSGNSVFGCWGNKGDPYYGGGSYAEMLKRVYPAVKQGNRNANVVLGGLLLNCDPSRPPAGADCTPARFLEGVFRNGGAQAIDMIAYHGYPVWDGTNRDWELYYSSWQHRGGVVFGKLNFIQSVMTQYNVNKPIMMNEGGLLCVQTSCPPAFYDAQANYAIRLFTRTQANGLYATFWYTLNGPGWREGALLDSTQTPRPAFYAFKFLATTLEGAEYAGQLAQGNLEGYAFRKGTTEYRVYWTNDGSTAALPAQTGLRAAYTKVGQPIGFNGSVGFDPIVLELAR